MVVFDIRLLKNSPFVSYLFLFHATIRDIDKISAMQFIIFIIRCQLININILKNSNTIILTFIGSAKYVSKQARSTNKAVIK